METRASHLLIGTFVLVFVGAALGFVVWLAKVDFDRKFDYYAIYFDGAVSGLSVGGDVRFNGIPVGTVSAIDIDPTNPARVRVIVEVAADTPIRVDTIASLELQGITGVAFVELKGGSPGAPMLAAASVDEIPEIRSTSSAMQELFEGAPELINRIITLVGELTLLVGEENRTHVTNILANADVVAGTLARRAPEIEEIIVNLNQTNRELAQTMARLNGLIGRLDTVAESTDQTLTTARGTLKTVDDLIANQVVGLTQELNVVAKDLSKLTRDINGFLDANRESLDVFASDGLVQFSRFVEEARQLVGSASRLVEDVGSDPGRFLFGRGQGVEADQQ
jgi:phospholipid/cholesterol/gamma-HCH transport system substrate-binding protein